MPLSFTDITKEHERFLKEMLFEALYVREGEPPFERSILEEPNIKKYYFDWNRNNDIGIILQFDNQMIGACWSRTFSTKKPSYGFVDEQTPELTIAIKKDFQKKGMGTKLLLELFKRNKNVGFTQISLSVDQESPALRLYQKLGFEVHEVVTTAFTMVKKL